MVDFEPHNAVYEGDHAFRKRTPNDEFGPNMHYHDFYEIQIYVDGTSYLIVDDKEYELGHGDIVLLDMFSRHELVKSKSKDYCRYCISVDLDLMLSICGKNLNVRSIFSQLNPNVPVKHFSPDEFEKYLKLIEKYERIDCKRANEIFERAVLFELCGNLYLDCYDEKSERISKSGHVEVITKLIKYVSENLKNDLSLERLSEVSNFSAYHLCRLFKKNTGYTINQYVIGKRVEKAKLLIDRNFPIGEIAVEVGFSNYSCFYKAFVRETGIGPAEYKAKHNKIKLQRRQCD
ncbi:MAG: AraC family transcriptional regulator [Clostridiales bacterium]|nr:AraC family transcriptional regulator [Clostridiales bacterium]